VEERKPAWTYRDAGVDIDAGERAVELMRSEVEGTRRPEVLGGIGGFGGFFALEVGRYRQPVLVAGADGVGTKLRLAIELGRHRSVGIDVVAMCVNDILVHGAEPLFFLDYLAMGRLVPEKAAEIVAGVAEGCRLAGCALLGGETAEMPGFYPDEDYDLAGFAVGVVERERLIDGSAIRPGDRLLGLASSGLHSNGFSLARKVLLEVAGYSLRDRIPALGCELGEELLRPTRIYVRSVLPLALEGRIRGMAHITGGGLLDNLARILPPGTKAVLESGSWPVPPIFELIREAGNVAPREMARTFNLGLGLVLVVAPEEAETVRQRLTAAGERCYPVGRIEPGNREVELFGAGVEDRL
jgi:phosphoribosylformylglycinamidine cyclo-ligase